MSRAREFADLAGSADAGGITGKNLIINGAMQVAQRGTSISRAASNIAYTLDRFITRANSSCSHTVTQETDAPEGFLNSLKVVRDSGQTGSTIRFEQPIETNVMTQCRGKKVTLSFYAKKDSGATVPTLSVNLYTGDGTEGQRAITAYANEVSAINAETATLTTSWQRFTFTSSSTLITDLSQMAVVFIYSPTGTAPSNDGYFITGVQLEVGEQATPFEHRSYGDELARCQRYFQKSYADDTNPGTVTENGALWTNIIRDLSNQNYWDVRCYQVMRSSPTVTTYSTSSGTSGKFRNTSAGGADYDSASSNLTGAGFSIRPNSGASQNSGDPIAVHWTADAEL